MEYSKDDLIEAKRQIDSTLHKLKETVKTLESKENVSRLKSQITLAKRRIKAFEIANYFLENEIKKDKQLNFSMFCQANCIFNLKSFKFILKI